MRADRAQARLEAAREACEGLVQNQQSVVEERVLAALAARDQSQERSLDADAALQRQLMKNASLEREIRDSREELALREAKWREEATRQREGEEGEEGEGGGLSSPSPNKEDTAAPFRGVGDVKAELVTRWSGHEPPLRLETPPEEAVDSQHEERIERLGRELAEAKKRLSQAQSTMEEATQKLQTDHAAALQAAVEGGERLAAMREAEAAKGKEEEASQARVALKQAQQTVREERQLRSKERSDRIKAEHERHSLRDALRLERLAAATLSDEVDAYQYNAAEHQVQAQRQRQARFLAVARLVLAERARGLILACVWRWGEGSREASIEAHLLLYMDT